MSENISEKRPRRCRKLTLKEKNAIIDLVEGGEKNVSVASIYGVSKTTIGLIMKKKDLYKNKFKELPMTMKNRTRIDSGKYPLLEKILLDWFKQMRSSGIPVQGSMIREKARMINEQLQRGETENEVSEAGYTAEQSPTFTASEGWLNNFKRRNGIRQISYKKERKAADKEGADKLPEEIKSPIKSEGYDLDEPNSTDDTGQFHKSLPKKTLDIAEEKETSEFKGAEEQPRCPKGDESLPVIYTHNSNVWIKTEETEEWLSEDNDIPAWRESIDAELIEKYSNPEDNKSQQQHSNSTDSETETDDETGKTEPNTSETEIVLSHFKEFRKWFDVQTSWKPEEVEIINRVQTLLEIDVYKRKFDSCD